MRGKIDVKSRGGRRKNIKIRYFFIALALIGAMSRSTKIVEASSCPSLRVVFVRGSGGERWADHNYLAYKDSIDSKLKTTKLDYEFIDLDYPAISVGVENLNVTIGAYIGAGEAYEFGRSVNTGVNNLISLINSCPNTKYVVGGYSQGAMVISKALKSLNAKKVLYAATFGDPKIFLPEGKGIIPEACANRNLSEYRMYVPDCQAYKGLLGAYEPYQPDGWSGKVGTWCNKRDIFCSSRFSISDHVAYVSENLYEDASRVIFDKITKAFGIKNTISSPHDTAILIDTTGSMKWMIEKYKSEALRLAKETLDSGGRVALFDYRDLDDPYQPMEYCNFETCTITKIEKSLSELTVQNGGDEPESLLSASFHVMNKLNWKLGSTKSLVVLTDANFLSPDRDGITMEQVVKLSKEIDPVNFYIITSEDYLESYQELAAATDGKVVTIGDEISLLTDYILERYDSLPRVEENDALILPTLTITDTAINENKATLKFDTSGDKVLVILNEMILGITTEREITISGLWTGVENRLILVPVTNDVRGEGVEVNLSSNIPGAPNTGYLELK